MSAHNAKMSIDDKAEAKKRKPRLSRQRIMSAALDQIDTHGLESLNMRQLGNALNAATMSVYRHFGSKADLLDAIVDDIIAKLPPTNLGGPWQEQLREFSLRAREAMITHPDLAPMIGLEFRRSAVSLRINAEFIETLRKSGVPEGIVSETYWAMASFTNGYGLLEAQTIRRAGGHRPSSERTDRTQKLTSILQDTDNFPEELIPQTAQVLAHTIDEQQFKFGLDCLIMGLEAKLSVYIN